MKRILTTVLTCFVLVSLHAADRPACFDIKEFTLSNGLKVWLNEDHDQPKIFGAMVVKAGAKDCPNTGIAHYFEHIMFKGTDKIGTVDYASEKILLDSIALKYDELATVKNDSLRLHIQQEINGISKRAADYAVPNEFVRLISRYGGSGLNAGTSFDYTAYFNEFSPQYINQWAEINSERLINPVFRLFQSELETVYEEKNMYEDKLGSMAVEKVLERFFAPHPYSYPILGSTDNLKNPKLSDMRKFFESYYVAGNMGLILCGDFNSTDILPILEKHFSRIRPGQAPLVEMQQPKPFNGKETFEALLPIPLIKPIVLGWRGTPLNHPDEVALGIAVSLLNNENGTGYLDKLMVEGKLMAAQALNLNLNDAGITALIVLPNLMGQSAEKAKSLVMEQMNRIRKGDFSDDAFMNLKLEARRNHEKELESIRSRAKKMMSLLSQGKSWDDYLSEINTIDALTKEDIVNVTNKYFTDNYLEVTKKMGNYPKNKLKKPDFAPIIPKNGEAKSEFARNLEQQVVPQGHSRFLNFEEQVQTRKLAPNATLYQTMNPVDSIFSIRLKFHKGQDDSKLLEPLTVYLNYIGTDSLTFNQFNDKIRSLGSTMLFTADPEYFYLTMEGFDRNLESTIKLAGYFLKHFKADPKKLKQVVDAVKVRNKSMKASSDILADALLNKVRYGENSSYLKRLSLAETKKLKAQDLINEFRSILKVACDIHYCGTQPIALVETVLRKNIEVDSMQIPSEKPVYKRIEPVNANRVYFMDSPKSAQSIVSGYIPGGFTPTAKDHHQAVFFNEYFGSGMSSLVFQQIREFRSLAYHASAKYWVPAYKFKDKSGYLRVMLSTQCDKTLDAMMVLDSLIRFMPAKESRLATAREEALNEACNAFPDFRHRSLEIADLKIKGYLADPNQELADSIGTMGLKDILNFYEKNISGRPIAWVVLGNKEKIDLSKLAAFGEIVFVKPKEVYK